MAATDAVQSDLLDTVVKLVNLGFAGVGVVVLLFVFIILMRDKPADAPTQQLRGQFLAGGLGFAVFCGVASIAAPLLAPKAVPAGPTQMLLNFSPSFASQGLPPPLITLPDGNVVAPGARFDAESGQVLVSVDDALKNVATLRQTAVSLAENATAAQKQADSAVAALASAQGPPAPPIEAAKQQAAARSLDSQAATSAVTNSIKLGNFKMLRLQNDQLDHALTASIAARQQVIQAAR